MGGWEVREKLKDFCLNDSVKYLNDGMTSEIFVDGGSFVAIGDCTLIRPQ
jgi:hypothetical protein